MLLPTGKSIMDISLHRNRLLSYISQSDAALLAPHLDLVELKLKTNLEPANTEIAACYFLTSGIASVVATGRNGKTIEVGLIGNEGVTGSAAILGTDRSPNATFMQEEGGYRIATGDLRRAMAQSRSLSTALRQCLRIHDSKRSDRAHQWQSRCRCAPGTVAVDGPGPIHVPAIGHNS